MIDRNRLINLENKKLNELACIRNAKRTASIVNYLYDIIVHVKRKNNVVIDDLCCNVEFKNRQCGITIFKNESCKEAWYNLLSDYYETELIWSINDIFRADKFQELFSKQPKSFEDIIQPFVKKIWAIYH